MKIPFSISVYEHAAAFLGRTPWEVSRDAELAFQAHLAAYRRYRHFPLVVGIDIYNLEAEAYGATVGRAEGASVPALAEHPCRDLDDALALPTLDPKRAGRIPMFVEAARRLKAAEPEAHVCLPVSGPFSIMLGLMGLGEAMMALATEPNRMREALEKLVDGQLAYAQMVVEAGLDVVFFESGAAPPLMSPALFRRVESPPLARVVSEVGKIAGHPVACVIGGDTAPIVPEIVETGTNFVICPAETDRALFLKNMAPWPEVKVRVNMESAVLVRGTREDIAEAIDEVVALLHVRPNLLLGTGALPYDTPPDNVEFAMGYVGG